MTLANAVKTLKQRREWLDQILRNSATSGMVLEWTAERAALDIALMLMLAELRRREQIPYGERQDKFNSVSEMFEP